MHKPGVLRYWQNGFLQSAVCAVCVAIAALAATSASAGNTSGSQPPGQSTERTAPIASSTLFQRYRDFLGSDANARSVIQGLRYGELITLGGGASGSLKFLPPTRAMSWANIDRILNAAQSGLASIGIAQPNAGELKVILTGGTLIGGDGRRFAMKSLGPGSTAVSFTGYPAAPAASSATQAALPDSSHTP